MNTSVERRCLFQQTNHHKLVRRRSRIEIVSFYLITCCLLFILVKQTTQTYTNTFIDHKTLLAPKQLITNTLKQIKPKFNPRRFTSSNDKQLSVYDLSAGDVKTIRKQPVKEQIQQGTYYYTDYKAPAIKNLIPMSPHCPETGRTVCKDAKAYPVDSILNLILEAKANKFNFSSLFVDESQNSDMPNLPELESTIAKACGSTDEKTPEYDEDPNYSTKSTSSKTNTDNRPSYGAKTKTNHKRPGDSSVYYDNSLNDSPKSNSNYPTSNYENNYDRYEQQRINDNAYSNEAKSSDTDSTKSYDSDDQADKKLNNQQPVDQTPSIQQQPIQQQPIQQQIYQQQPIQQQPIQQQPIQQQPIQQQPIQQQPIQQQTIQQQQPIHQQPIHQQPMQPQIYQQPQSSIKFEQQYQPQNRHQLNSAQSYRSLKAQDLNYRNSNPHTYYQTRKNPNRPYKTTVTIIPFIQYITQLPTDGYQISADKQLLDTITQLRHTPLSNYSPDAWLPIKAYTTTDQREIDEHLSNDRLPTVADLSTHHKLAASDYVPNYTQNYRDKRSTICENENKEENKTETGEPAVDSTRRIGDATKDDENSSITRVKKQAGFDEEPEELCQTKKLFITPKAALNDKSEWRYIVNVGERDSRLKQVIKVDVCASPNGPCSSQISLPFGYVSKCKQKYIKKKLLAIDPDGQSTSTESFFIPSCCVCEIVRMNQK